MCKLEQNVDEIKVWHLQIVISVLAETNTTQKE